MQVCVPSGSLYTLNTVQSQAQVKWQREERRRLAVCVYCTCSWKMLARDAQSVELIKCTTSSTVHSRGFLSKTSWPSSSSTWRAHEQKPSWVTESHTEAATVPAVRWCASPPVSPARPVPLGAGTCSGCRPTGSASTFCARLRPPGYFLRWRPGAVSRPVEVDCSLPPQRTCRCDPREALSWCLHCPTAASSPHLPAPHRCPEGEDNLRPHHILARWK